MKLLVTTLAALSVTFTVSVACGQQTESCLYNTNGPAVAQIIYSYTTTVGNGPPKEGAPLQGSGILISSKGHILTAAHVISPETGISEMIADQTITVRLGSLSDNPTPVKAIVIRKDPDLDLALLKIPEPSHQVMPAPMGRSSSLTVGDRLIALGFPKSDLAIVPQQPITAKNTIVHGVVKPWWQTALALNHGDSGGPVFGKLGTVVGVANSMLEGTQEIGYVVPIQYAAPLLDQAGVEIARAGPCADLPACPAASNGIERYTIDEQIPGNSGWRGGGYNQTAYCNDRKTDLQRLYSNSILTETGRSENSHKDWAGHVTYIYYCTFRRQKEPIYKSAPSLDCIK